MVRHRSRWLPGLLATPFGARALSTRRPARKPSPYSIQNVQASFSFLFQQKATEAGADTPKSRQPLTGSFAGNGKEAQRTSRQISFKFLFDTSSSNGSSAEGTKVQQAIRRSIQTGVEPPAAAKKIPESSLSNASNQVATLRYLFANKNNSTESQQAPHRRGRKKENKGLEFQATKDELKHKNLIVSLRFLFGNEHAWS